MSEMKAMAYWGGWANAPIPDYNFWLLPCFAHLEWDGTSYWTDYSESGNFPYPASSGPYVTWNQWQNNHDNCSGYARTLLSYGGDTNENFRTWVADNQQLSDMAGELIANVDKYFFCGLELDIEDWWVRSRQVNENFATNLITLVNILGPLLQKKGKPLVVAVGETSADPNNPGDRYVGTMIPFYQSSAMQFVTQINVMGYELTRTDDFGPIDRTLAQFVAAGVPSEKLSAGIKPVAGPQPSLETVKRLCAHLKENGFGGAFLWGIGMNDSMPASPTASEYVKAMLEGFGLPA